VIPQKSYVCDSYITDKKSLYAGPPVGGMHPPHPPPWIRHWSESGEHL